MPTSPYQKPIEATMNENLGKTMKANGKKILVVDDDANIALLIKEGLERKGFHIESFNDPQVALQEFKPGFYDLMPKLDGFEFFLAVRKNDIKVKVCFITAFFQYRMRKLARYCLLS